MENKELEIRKLLWLTHHCGQSYLYGDDGEMQCHLCGLDFRRHSESRIVNTFNKVGSLKFGLEVKQIDQGEFDSSIAIIRLENLIRSTDEDS